jgi:hypothetical protein
MQSPSRWFRSQATPDRWLGAFLLLGFAFRALYFALCVPYLRLVGDERFYFERSRDLVLLLTSPLGGAEGGFAQALDRIVGNGWFMPGMSVLLLPVRLFSEDVTAVRLWVALVNAGLFLLLLRRCDQVLGRRSARVLAGLGCLLPILVSYTFVLWGELIAGQITLLLFLHLRRVQERLVDRPLTGREGAALGAVLLVLVYIRPSLILLLPLVLVLLAAQHLALPEPRRFLTRMTRAALPMLLVFGLGLAPWSIALSSRMDGFFLTTTSIDLNTITSFAPRERFAETPMESVSAYTVNRQVRAMMAQSGLGYKQALHQLSETMLADMTLDDYRAGVRRNVATYFLTPNGFSERAAELILREAPADTRIADFRKHLLAVMRGLNLVAWVPLLLASVLLLVIPFTLERGWSMPVAIKGLFWSVAVQPFVSAVHLRHFVALIPVMLLGAAVISGSERPRIWRPRDCTTLGHRMLYAGDLLAMLLTVLAFLLFV